MPIGFKDISLIIPLAPQEDAWEALAEELSSFGKRFGEIIFVVAQKKQANLLAKKIPLPRVRIERSALGRAKQLNAGARAAATQYLWFLHADSRLSEKSFLALKTSINEHPHALHYFALSFLKDGPTLMWINTIGCWIRSRWLGIPFGDQGLCLSKKLFFALGGFPEDVPYGEDHLFIWKVRQNDMPLHCIPATIQTSARRYSEEGWLRLTLRYAHRWIRQAWPEWKKLREGKVNPIGTTF